MRRRFASACRYKCRLLPFQLVSQTPLRPKSGMRSCVRSRHCADTGPAQSAACHFVSMRHPASRKKRTISRDAFGPAASA
jgi:hypothetical protein